MKAKLLGVVFSAVLCAGMSFGQGSSQPNQSKRSASSTDESSVSGKVVTGRVTKYTPGQSISVREQDGKTQDYDLSNTQANIDPSVKVGSRVKVSETNNNGQKMLNVEPMAASRGANVGASSSQSASNDRAAAGNEQRLPRTASNAPLLALLGLMSLGAAAGARVAAKKLR